MPKLFVFIIGWTSFCVLMFLLFGIFTMIHSYKLGRYIKRNYYKTWRRLTSIGGFGPGLANPFRGIPYLFKETNESDEKLLRLKDAARISTRYFIIWFATTAVTIIFSVVILLIFFD